MVTRNDLPQEVLPGEDAGLPEFNIQDSTSPDQLEIEAELDAEIEQGDADVEVQADEAEGADREVAERIILMHYNDDATPEQVKGGPCRARRDGIWGRIGRGRLTSPSIGRRAIHRTKLQCER